MKRLVEILATGFMTVSLVGPAVMAQAQDRPAMDMDTQSPSRMNHAGQGPGMAEQSPMDRCANMCAMMMQKEAAAMPWILGVGSLFGILVLAALALLVVLEIQWVRLWTRRLRQSPPVIRSEHT